MGSQKTDRPEGEGQGQEVPHGAVVEAILLEEATEKLLLEWVGKKFVDGMHFDAADLAVAAIRCAKVVLTIQREAAIAVGVVLGERDRGSTSP